MAWIHDYPKKANYHKSTRVLGIELQGDLVVNMPEHGCYIVRVSPTEARSLLVKLTAFLTNYPTSKRCGIKITGGSGHDKRL